MFERFTDEARSAVVRAQQEARDHRDRRIGPAHLLLAVSAGTGRGHAALTEGGIDPASLATAVARAGDPLDADALAVWGVDLDRVRSAAEATFGPGSLDGVGSGGTGHLRFADGSRRALEEALRLALRSGRRRGRRIDDGHILAGVLTVADPTVTRSLQQLGVDPVVLLERLGGASAA